MTVTAIITEGRKKKNCTIRKEHITHCKLYYVIICDACEIIHITPPAKAGKLFTCEYSLVFFIILHTCTRVRACTCVDGSDFQRHPSKGGIGCLRNPCPLFGDNDKNANLGNNMGRARARVL